jgi:urease subunit gamma/beta
MHLTPREQERLLLAAAADLARRRLARGAPLGATEAIALVCDEICELAWDGVALETIIERSRAVVPASELLPGVASLVPVLEVEALFPWGTTLVHVDRPFPEDQNQQPPYLERTGETLAPSPSPAPGAAPGGSATDDEDSDGARGRPGVVRAAAGSIALAPGAPRRAVVLRNNGHRDVWISSHFPLDQVNPAVEIRFADGAETGSVRVTDSASGDLASGDSAARPPTGYRLDLPAGEALLVRPGEERTATAVATAGSAAPVAESGRGSAT